MPRTVNLPPGCAGFSMLDGTQYRGREGGSVSGADGHAPFIERQVGGDAGLVGSASFRQFTGTKDGRWCAPCRKIWNRWNLVCVKCGADTAPEAEMPQAPPSQMPSACAVPITSMGVGGRELCCGTGPGKCVPLLPSLRVLCPLSE